MSEKQNGPGLDIVALDPNRFEQFVGFPNECVFVLSVYRRGVVFVEKDSRIGNVLWKVFAEPEVPLGPGGRAPGVPGVGSVVLAARVQTMDGKDAACRQSGWQRSHEHASYSTFAVSTVFEGLDSGGG